MQYFDKALYWISSGLLVPVMIAVFFFFIRGLLLVGQFYGFYTDRLKYNRVLRQVVHQLTDGNTDALLTLPPSDTLLAQAIRQLVQHRNDGIFRNKIISDFEVDCEKDLDKNRTLSKMGPLLGLMGTLIPLGPALAGLAAGDIATMSQQMQIAFNTTVIGLVIGATGYLTLQAKQRWYAADFNQLEFINDVMNENDPTQ
jgi:biopolymer transport protein ExbB/TolQ